MLLLGASSYTDSKINLNNSGTYNFIEGNAPAWDNVNGWKLDGVNNWLQTSAIVPTDQNTSLILKYSNMIPVVGDNRWIFGKVVGGKNTSFNNHGSTDVLFGQIGSSSISYPLPTSGIVAIANPYLYLNGVIIGVMLPAITPFTDNTERLYLGTLDSFPPRATFYAQYVAAYNKVLTQSQIQAIGNLMV